MGKVIYDAKKSQEFGMPYVDIDEWRERELTDGTKVPYRFIHGGFQEKKVKFSFCFPEKEAYEGRFYQYLSPFPGPDEEMASFGHKGENDRIAFCLLHGAYSVESNMGSSQMFGGMSDPTIVWRASAAVAEYSRVKAMEIYECERPYGYVYGGSGGGYKSMACIENTNAWDGALPYVIGSPVSLPNTITMHAQGQRVLRNCFGKIVDALDAGGSGNMYEGLHEDEAAMLKELTQMGFPPLAWYMEAKGKIDDGSLPVLTPGVKAADPEYFREFWETEGYMGADPSSTACRDRLQFTGIVKEVSIPGAVKERSAEEGLNGVDDAWKKALTDGNGAWIELEELPEGEDLYLRGVALSPLTGKAAGKQLLLDQMIRKEDGKGGYLTIGMCYGMDDLQSVLASIEPGDQISMDNSDYIAIQSYYRHQVPADLSFHAWDQFRDENGNPVLPQRSNVMGYGFTGTGTVQDGNIQGKVIQLQALMDESTCPWCADWYRNKVIETKGSAKNYRTYFMERCMHGDVDWCANYMVVNYLGALRQGLLDLAAWVEKGIEPLKDTVYTLCDGQIYTEKDIRKRYGMQALIDFKANGSRCAHVKVGEEVMFSIDVQVPENAGEVTEIAMTFEEDETVILTEDQLFPDICEVKRYKEDVICGAKAEAVHKYEKPGTYFAVVRVKSQRNGDSSDIFTQVKNLERVRVIVG